MDPRFLQGCGALRNGETATSRRYSDELCYLRRQRAPTVEAHREVHGADGGLELEVHGYA